MEEFERPYKKVSVFKAVVLFLFRRKAFEAMAVKHDTAWVLSTSPDLRKRFLNGEYTPDEESTRENVEKRTAAIRKSLRASGLLVFLSALVAGAIGWYLHYVVGVLPSWLNTLLQSLGAGCILWATIWELGWNVRSFGGESLPERVHYWIFRTLCVFGTFLFFLAFSWAA